MVEHEHTYMMRQNLADIESYANAMLGNLEHGAGELPQWTDHIISTVRTHMHDVVHFLRHQAREGRHYGMSGRGMDPWYGRAGVETTGKEFYAGDARPAPQRRYGVPGIPYPQPGWWGQGGVATADSPFLAGARRYAGQEKPASMARKNLREISEYARQAAGHLQHGAGIAPSWLENKLSIAAGCMDGMGHWLDNEGVEGRKYGQRDEGRARDGGGRARPSSAGGHRAGSGYQPHRNRRGRFWKKHPHRHVPYHPVWGYVPWMIPGIGIDRTGFQTDIHLGEPEPVPHVTKVYAHMVRQQLLPEIPDSHAIIGMLGSGFSAIDVPSVRIRYKLNGEWREDDAPIVRHTDDQLEIALPISKQVAHSFELTDIGYFENGSFIRMSSSFFQATKYPYRPFAARNYGRAFQIDGIQKEDISIRRYALNLAQKFESHPGPIRPHSQAEGRRLYGMTPGEAVDMQTPMGYVQRPWRSLSPGYGPVQEYGSMGYGSMGTGSMDRAVQQAMLQRTKGARVP